MKKVIIYKGKLLPISETFIPQQMRGFTTWKPILIGEERVEDGLDISDLDVRLLPRSKQGKIACLYRKLSRLFGIALLADVKMLKSLGASLAHVHFGTEAVAIWPTLRKTRLSVLVTLHGYDINRYEWWWKSKRRISPSHYYPQRLRAMAKHPRVHFLAVSKAIKQRAIEFGIPADKVTVSYIGVDVVQFRPQGQPITQRNKRILFVGRMVENKAPQLLVRAFRQVRNAIPDAELTMIGDGPLLTQTKVLAQELDVPVEFLGACTNTEVRQQMQQARVFCLPSVTVKYGDSEGLSIVILEAQASGVPVVTSARGGATEGIIDSKTGVRFAEGDQSALSDGLVKILQDDAFAEAASVAAVQHTREQFDIRKCSRELEGIYDRYM